MVPLISATAPVEKKQRSEEELGGRASAERAPSDTSGRGAAPSSVAPWQLIHRGRAGQGERPAATVAAVSDPSTIYRPELKWWDALLSVLGLLIVLAAWFANMVMNLLLIAVVLYVPFGLLRRLWWGWKGKLVTRFARQPLAAGYRWLLLQAAVRVAFLIVWLLVLRACFIPLQAGDDAMEVWAFSLGAFGLIALFQALPQQRVLLGRNLALALLVPFLGVQLLLPYVPGAAAEALTMDSPFAKELLIFQGGRSPLTNHHFLISAQRNALDLVLLKDGKWVTGKEADFTADTCFGEPVYAPLSGTVVRVVNDRPDMAIGKMDREQIVGNHVVLEVAPERFVLFGHLKQGSVQVREGDAIPCGRQLAQCGNSGNTTVPHLHLQVQSRADFAAPDLRTFPILFRNASLLRAGAESREPDLLRRNDRLRPDEARCQ